MNYDWFKIFNKDEFEALDLVSKEYTFDFDGYGLKNLLVTKGNLLSVKIDDIFLSVNLNDKNPFAMDQRAIFIDPDNNVYVGIEV